MLTVVVSFFKFYNETSACNRGKSQWLKIEHLTDQQIKEKIDQFQENSEFLKEYY